MRKHRVNISKHLLNLKQETKINYQQFWNDLTLKHKQVLQNIAKKIWLLETSKVLNVASRDQVFRGLCYFVGGSPW